MLCQTLGHQVKSLKNLLYPLEAAFSVTMFVKVIFTMNLELGYVGSKTRSLGQIIEEPMLVTKGF